MGREEHCNEYHWCVLTVIQPPWVWPHSWRVCFPSLHCSCSRLFFWGLSDAGPGLYALPRSKLLRFRFLGTPQRCRLLWACVLCPSQVQAAQETRCLVSALSLGGWCVFSLHPSQPLSFLGEQWEHLLRCDMCLFWGANLWLQRSQRMSSIQDPRKTWLATGSLPAV